MTDETFPGSINILQAFQSDLLRDEKILWDGQPKTSLFNSTDYFITLIAMIGGGGALMGLVAAVSSVNDKPPGLSALLPSLLPMIVMLPFLLYLMFGRLLYRFWKNKHTYYAVTNQRILILYTVPSKSLQAIFINTLPALHKSTNSKGTGTITFGNSDPRAAVYANSGLDFLASANGMRLAPAFYNINNVKNIYDLIIRQRSN